MPAPPPDPADLAADIEAAAAETAAFLAGSLDRALGGAPPRLAAAIRHGALDGGKRLRPYLVRTAAALFGVPAPHCLAAGAAVECVHCYSLIHDDLPDMDNDRLRRGKPAVWAAFDPATAILAGDALLTHAFALLADPATHPDADVRVRLAATLAEAAGAAGMVGGQMADIAAETDPLDTREIVAMQAMKTGALIAASAKIGGIVGGADADALGALGAYGRAAGLAFQLADDILDATGSSTVLGKTAGKDAARNKSTLVARDGLAAARSRLDAAVGEAVNALARFGAEADTLREAARYFGRRQA